MNCLKKHIKAIHEEASGKKIRKTLMEALNVVGCRITLILCLKGGEMDGK